MPTLCTGLNDDHCCYLKGVVCRHLEENTVPGRRWACGLKRVHGTWDAVYASPEWPAVLQDAIDSGLGENYKCGEWPRLGEKCWTCGLVGVGV